jgi:alpha-beta hydrolase superfamily lysophospholipase
MPLNIGIGNTERVRRLLRSPARWIGAGFAVYAAALALLWWGQERLLFVPQVLPASHHFDFGADVHERRVEVDGASLHLLHLKLPAPRGVVFYLHGNAGNLAGWFVNAELYRRANFDLVMLDYRGYGKSSGHIESEAQLHADVRAVWDSIARDYAGKPRVLIGRSLGTGLAASLAAQVQPELTILVAPYLSMQALAAEHYPWVPGALLRYRLRTDQAVVQLRNALLLVHGERDELIAPWHSQALHRLQPRAHLQLVAGAGHNDLQDFDAYHAAIREALAGR